MLEAGHVVSTALSLLLLECGLQDDRIIMTLTLGYPEGLRVLFPLGFC